MTKVHLTGAIFNINKILSLLFGPSDKSSPFGLMVLMLTSLEKVFLFYLVLELEKREEIGHFHLKVETCWAFKTHWEKFYWVLMNFKIIFGTIIRSCWRFYPKFSGFDCIRDCILFVKFKQSLKYLKLNSWRNWQTYFLTDIMNIKISI